MQISSFESSLCRRFSFIQQTHETIFRIHKASCSLVLSVDNPHYILLTIRSESSYLYLDLNNLYKTVAIIQPKIKLVQKDNNSTTMIPAVDFPSIISTPNMPINVKNNCAVGTKIFSSGMKKEIIA